MYSTLQSSISVIECACPLLNRAELVELSGVANRRILETELAMIVSAEDLPPVLEVTLKGTQTID